MTESFIAKLSYHFLLTFVRSLLLRIHLLIRSAHMLRFPQYIGSGLYVSTHGVRTDIALITPALNPFGSSDVVSATTATS